MSTETCDHKLFASNERGNVVCLKCGREGEMGLINWLNPKPKPCEHVELVRIPSTLVTDGVDRIKCLGCHKHAAAYGIFKAFT